MLLLMKIQLLEKSKKDQEDEEEHETPKAAEGPKLVRNEEEEHMPEDHDITEPQRPSRIAQ